MSENKPKRDGKVGGIFDSPMCKRSVTPEQFVEWVRTNEHRTWSHAKGFVPGAYPRIKYFYPCLDTRDMKIFRITTKSMDYVVDFRDEFDGNILEQLEDLMLQDKNAIDAEKAL